MSYERDDTVTYRAGRAADDLHLVELAGLLHELTALLIEAGTVQDALDRLVGCIARAVPAVAGCSVSLVGDGMSMSTATFPACYRPLDAVQYESGLGPCLDATRTRTLVTSQDLAADDRWPPLSARAAGLGVHAVASVPLDVRRNAVGAINLFVPRRDGIDSCLLITAMAVAGQAEVLLSEMFRRAAEAEATADLVASLRRGATVDHAVGVLVAQRGCGVQEAYEVLREIAHRLNVRPLVVAERLVETAVRRAEQPDTQ